MMHRLAIALTAASLSGCAVNDHPVWAIDPMYVEPTDDGIYALVSWEIFGDRWRHRMAERHYICGVVVSLQGTPTDSCETCDNAWDVTSTVVEDDCDEFFMGEAIFPEITGLGLGSLPADLTDDAPFERVHGGFVSYDGGELLPHGWAYAESYETTGTPAETDWDQEQAFVFWPAFAWEIIQP